MGTGWPVSSADEYLLWVSDYCEIIQEIAHHMHPKIMLVYILRVIMIIAIVGTISVYMRGKNSIAQSDIITINATPLVQLPISTLQASTLPSPSDHKSFFSTRHKVKFDYPAHWYYESDAPENAAGDGEEYHFFVQRTKANWSESEEPGNEVMEVFIRNTEAEPKTEPDFIRNGNNFYSPVYGTPYDTNVVTKNDKTVTFRIWEKAKPYERLLFTTLTSEH